MAFECIMTYCKCNDINAKVGEIPYMCVVCPSALWLVERNLKCNVMCYERLYVTSIWIVQVYLYMWNMRKSDESIWFCKLCYKIVLMFWKALLQVMKYWKALLQVFCTWTLLCLFHVAWDLKRKVIGSLPETRL